MICNTQFGKRNFRTYWFASLVALAAAMPAAAAEIVFVSDFDNSHAIQWVQHHSVSHAGLTIEIGPAEITATRVSGGNRTSWLQVPPGLNGNPDYPNWSAIKIFGANTTTVNVGDCVLASGTISEFNGATELASVVTVQAPGLCGAIPVSGYAGAGLADVATDCDLDTSGNQPGPRTEELESVLLTLTSLSASSTNDSFGEFTVIQGGNFSCNETISNFFFTHTTGIGQTYSSITGILDQLNNFAPNTYWLLPRNASDVVTP